MLVLASMTLTLMDGHSGVAEEQNQQTCLWLDHLVCVAHYVACHTENTCTVKIAELVQLQTSLAAAYEI